MTDQLDLRDLVTHLDAVVAEARDPAGVDAEALLTRARRLLTKVRAAPVFSPDDDPSDHAGWQAVADGDDLVCWRDDGATSLFGTGADGRLRIVGLTVGAQAWGMRITSTGTSYVAPGEGVEGPADRRILERIKRQTDEERQRIARQVAARSRVCPRCSWVNEAGTTGCAFCGDAGELWAPSAYEAQRSVAPAAPTRGLPVPPEPETTAIPQSPTDLALPLFDIPTPPGRLAGPGQRRHLRHSTRPDGRRRCCRCRCLRAGGPRAAAPVDDATARTTAGAVVLQRNCGPGRRNPAPPRRCRRGDQVRNRKWLIRDSRRPSSNTTG